MNGIVMILNNSVDKTVAWIVSRIAAYEMLYPAYKAVKWEWSEPQLSQPNSFQVSLALSVRQSTHITTRHSFTFLSFILKVCFKSLNLLFFTLFFTMWRQHNCKLRNPKKDCWNDKPTELIPTCFKHPDDTNCRGFDLAAEETKSLCLLCFSIISTTITVLSWPDMKTSPHLSSLLPKKSWTVLWHH